MCSAQHHQACCAGLGLAPISCPPRQVEVEVEGASSIAASAVMHQASGGSPDMFARCLPLAFLHAELSTDWPGGLLHSPASHSQQDAAWASLATLISPAGLSPGHACAGPKRTAGWQAGAQTTCRPPATRRTWRCPCLGPRSWTALAQVGHPSSCAHVCMLVCKCLDCAWRAQWSHCTGIRSHSWPQSSHCDHYHNSAIPTCLLGAAEQYECQPAEELPYGAELTFLPPDMACEGHLVHSSTPQEEEAELDSYVSGELPDVVEPGEMVQCCMLLRMAGQLLAHLLWLAAIIACLS